MFFLLKIRCESQTQDLFHQIATQRSTDAQYSACEDKLSSEKEAEEEELKERFLDFQDSERRYISKSIPGAIIENLLNKTHPMSFGLGDKYFSLKTDDRHYSLLKKATNVVYVPKDYKSYCFKKLKIIV